MLLCEDPPPAGVCQGRDVWLLHQEVSPRLLWLGQLGLEQVDLAVELLQRQSLLPLERHVAAAAAEVHVATAAAHVAVAAVGRLVAGLVVLLVGGRGGVSRRCVCGGCVSGCCCGCCCGSGGSRCCGCVSGCVCCCVGRLLVVLWWLVVLWRLVVLGLLVGGGVGSSVGGWICCSSGGCSCCCCGSGCGSCVGGGVRCGLVSGLIVWLWIVWLRVILWRLVVLRRLVVLWLFVRCGISSGGGICGGCVGGCSRGGRSSSCGCCCCGGGSGIIDGLLVHLVDQLVARGGISGGVGGSCGRRRSCSCGGSCSGISGGGVGSGCSVGGGVGGLVVVLWRVVLLLRLVPAVGVHVGRGRPDRDEEHQERHHVGSPLVKALRASNLGCKSPLCRELRGGGRKGGGGKRDLEFQDGLLSITRYSCLIDGPRLPASPNQASQGALYSWDSIWRKREERQN